MIKEFFSEKDYLSDSNSIIAKLNIADFLAADSFSDKNAHIENAFSAQNAWINIGGWQSWNPGFELEPAKKQPSLHCHLLKQWNTYIEFPGTKARPSKNIVLGQFFTYLRWDDFYLVFVSCGNVNSRDVNQDTPLPPVQFIINRKENTVSIELCDTHKKWSKGQLQAKIEVFTASSYFEVRDKLKEVFSSSEKGGYYSQRFDQLSFLGKRLYGWESWYNHYEKINEALILRDLDSITKTENIISLCDNYTTKQNNVVFQIDDGWEKALGTWEIDEKLFPHGLKSITEKIEQADFVPGLWIAPIIVDLRSKSANEHPNWLLRDKKGHLVKAGFNPRWGADGTFYCLDLSHPEVLEYLNNLMNTIINEWGFRYVKLDFLYAGMHVGNHYDGKPAFESFANAIKLLTSRKQNAQGKPVTYLGCGTPFEMSFNDLPLSRIGCDTYEHWENKLLRFLNWNGRNEAYLNLKDTLGHALWNKIIFINDPDVIFIRKNNCSLTDDEKRLIALVAILFGNQIMYSDDPADCTSPEEIALSKEIISLIQKYGDEDFGLQQTGTDRYKLFTRSGKYEGEIDLGSKHICNIFERDSRA